METLQFRSRVWIWAWILVTLAAVPIFFFVRTTGKLSLTPLLGSVLIPVLLLWQPWKWAESRWIDLDRTPLRQPLIYSSAATVILLTLVQGMRFYAGDINAIDFTVFFDRPLAQTTHGRPLWVEVANSPDFSHRSQLAVHGFWLTLPIALLYLILATPWWLHFVAAASVALGALYTARIVMHVHGSFFLAFAGFTLFIFGGNTVRIVQYGFHSEVLYLWLIPWFLYAGLRDRTLQACVSLLLACLVKEDAFMPLAAAALALVLIRWKERHGLNVSFWLVVGSAVTLPILSLVVYAKVVLHAFLGDSQPTYSPMWGTYGATLPQAVMGMLTSPWKVLVAFLSSGYWYPVLTYHAFLPLLAWRWILGTLPIGIVYGASDYETLRTMGCYYAVVIVPFLVLGTMTAIAHILSWVSAFLPTVGRQVAVLLVLTIAVIAGGKTYTIKPLRPEALALQYVLEQLPKDRPIYVQSGLFVWAGYSQHIRALMPHNLTEALASGNPLVVASDISSYPFSNDELTQLLDRSDVKASQNGIEVRIGKTK